MELERQARIWRQLMWLWAIGFVLMATMALVFAHMVDKRDIIIRDQRIYIDGGCKGHYQGAGS